MNVQLESQRETFSANAISYQMGMKIFMLEAYLTFLLLKFYDFMKFGGCLWTDKHGTDGQTDFYVEIVF